MKKFSKFIVSHYERTNELLEAKFYYSFDEEEFFTETINFSALNNGGDFLIKGNNQEIIKSLLAHLHIALGISYYKLYPTETIVIKNLSLSDEQKKFWHTFYTKGLGEFFYRNKIDPRNLANIITEGENSVVYTGEIEFNGNKNLVLFGGGKDSLVTIEELKKKGEDFDLFSFGKDFPLHQMAQRPTESRRLIIKREIDLRKIDELLNQGYYNGHVPITGIIYFVGLVVSYIYGYKAVVTSLEKSANEGNTLYFDMEVNHQWSKSFEFEKMFDDYVKNNITSSFRCYSLLRDRYEIRIVKEFTKYSQYFYSFSSCNRNFHQKSSKLENQQLRCGMCPKCIFVYTMMRAFLDKDIVNKIFQKDLFEDPNLIPQFEELLGIKGIKPFECVGTNEEMVLAMRLIFKREKECNNKLADIVKKNVLSRMREDQLIQLEKKLLG